jgi:acyl-CoA thioesterase FadM
MTPGHHVWATTVRVTEVGARGVVSPSAVVDWLQTTAALHCHDAGWSIDRLRAEGFVWFVREFDLILDAPARHLDRVEVETWVSDLRRFRTHREYVVRTGEEVVARAQADWLFLGTTAQGKLRPRRPPEAMQDAFPFDPALGLRGEPPLAWADPDGAATTCLARRVMPSELDENAHVNHATYLDWLEDEALLDGRAPLRRARLEFLDDAAAGEEVEVQRWARSEQLEDARITRAGAPLVRAVIERPGA